MTHVVGEACVNCKYTDCVDVCPVDAFREGPNMLVIDPQECIDCTLCIAECPVGAIYPEDDLPATQAAFVEINARLAKVWPVILQSKRPAERADHWAAVSDKRALIVEEWKEEV